VERGVEGGVRKPQKENFRLNMQLDIGCSNMSATIGIAIAGTGNVSGTVFAMEVVNRVDAERREWARSEYDCGLHVTKRRDDAVVALSGSVSMNAAGRRDA
jgi:hypothetical protein